MGKKKWDDAHLRKAVMNSKSVRHVISTLGLIPAGGNYVQIKKRIEELGISTAHFTGKGWNKGLILEPFTRIPLSKILVKNSTFQSFKLKRRLFAEGIKKPVCEICGWSKTSIDGRIPVELDHINGDRMDNRIINLRILCPNCHSLQITHRGKNKKK